MNRYLLIIGVIVIILLAACGTPIDQAQEEVKEAAPTAEAPAEDAEVDTDTADNESEEVTEDQPGDASDNSLEGEIITIYHFGDLSGPYAAITSPLIFGMQDTVAAINEEGGIRGAEIELKFTDTAGNVDEAVAAYNRYTSDDDNILLMITYGSPEAEALASRFAEDKIPTLSNGLSSTAFYGVDSGYTFGLGPIYTEQFGYFLDWLTENWAEVKPEDAGDDIKLAYLSWPGAFGQGALTEESIAYAESLGVEIVATDEYEITPTADATTGILNAQAAEANVIWTNTMAFGPATVLNGLGSLGLRDEFLVAGDNWAMDLSTFAFLSDPGLATGMITPFPYLWWNDADHPGVQRIASIFEANERPDDMRNSGYLVMSAAIDAGVQAIEAAIDDVGYENLTGEAVYNALNNMGDIYGQEGVLRLNYADGNRSSKSAQIRRIEGGPEQFNVVQDWSPLPEIRPESE